ncbi:AMP-binding protein [Jatrophihabitans sp.]|uniref:AMP-binding protein n=1 Tax=Jatrophihabitans sp. TaxID=1932789 RepID=UPI0030C702D9|nr:short-chain acyl-CoA synthetase [Jatrophihabitans sp.]
MPRSIGPFVSADDAARYHAAGYWSAEETLPALLAGHAAERPDHLAVVDDLGQRITYRGLHEQSSRLAAAMASRGVGPGDVVGVQFPNRVEASVAALAIEKLGAVVCPMVTPYRKRELEHIITKTSMKLLFVPGTYRGYDHDVLGAELLAEHPSLETVVSLTSEPAASSIPFTAFVEQGENPHNFDRPVLDPDAVTAVLFTSGTEAAAKGVLHTHNTLLANVRALRSMLDLNGDDGVFMASPLGHGTGYGFGIRLACALGSTLSLLGVWNARDAAAMLSEYGAAYTHGATPFVLDLLELPDIASYDLSKLRYFVTGGATVTPGTATRVDEVLGSKLLRLYGQTEGFMATLSPVDESPDQVELSDGSPVAGVELRTVDDDGTILAAGEVGECEYRGPHRCVGFLDDPKREAANLTSDGWFRSGDLVSLAPSGALTVAGRKKEVINRGGYKYSPREIEDVLSAHEDIDRVAVVRMADARLVDRACAFVIPKPGRTPTTEDLAGFLKSRGIASFKWPERVELVTELPMTASGKVQKFQLEARLQQSAAPLDSLTNTKAGT